MDSSNEAAQHEDRPLLNGYCDEPKSRPLSMRDKVRSMARRISPKTVTRGAFVSTFALLLIVLLFTRKLPPTRSPSTILTFSDEQFGKFCKHSEVDNVTASGRNITEIVSCLAKISQSKPSQETKDLIRRAKEAHGFQQSLDDRALLYEGFRCFDFDMNLLIWGTGRDTRWFAEVNKGRTRFLENLPKWIDSGNDDLNAMDRDARIYEIAFNTNLGEENSYFDDVNSLVVDLPDDIWTTKWDFILVDSPEGFTIRKPGRMQSILTTRVLHQCHQFAPPFTPRIAAVHDMERHAERTWGEAILGRPLQCWDIMCMWQV